jgi:hypothetical protein
MKISTCTVVHAPPAEVWAVIGPQFADSAAWAGSVTSSVGVGVEGAALPGAPYVARECVIAAPGSDRLVEQITAYDSASMVLTYVVIEGLEHVAHRAALTWSVTRTPEGLSELRIDTDVTPSLVGRAMYPLLRHVLARASQRNAEELRHFVETGSPASPALERPSRRPSAQQAVAWNGAFSVLCGAGLVVFTPWWARQFAGAPISLMMALGAGLVAYGVLLTWVSRQGVTKPVRRVLAVLDGIWVAAVALLLAVTDHSFSTIGIVAALTSSVAVASFGALQWRG